METPVATMVQELERGEREVGAVDRRAASRRGQAAKRVCVQVPAGQASSGAAWCVAEAWEELMAPGEITADEVDRMFRDGLEG